MIIGEVVMPYINSGQESLIYNKALLLKRLNEADAFDVDLAPKHQDRLKLTFTHPGTFLSQITYGYKFEKNGGLKWNTIHSNGRGITMKIFPGK